MSKLTRYQFEVSITFIAPIISQSSGALRFGMDAALLRDRKNTPAIPGTLIQGNLRHYWQELFGESFGLGERNLDDSPKRGHLNFSEYWTYSTGSMHSDLQYRIKIDDETGRTEQGALQTIESRFPAGEPVTFKGYIFGWFDNVETANDFRIKISKGLHYMPAAGSFKGIGFGRVKEVKISCQKAKTGLLIEDYNENLDQIGLMIEPDRAFCFSRHLVGNNTRFNEEDIKEDINRDKTGLDNNFVSEDFIPGGAIKGAIATLLRKLSKQHELGHKLNNPDFPLLSNYLDKMVFTHAQPAKKNTYKRGHALPQSIVKAKDSFFDIAYKDKPGLINGEAPSFSTDWKPKDWAAAIKEETNLNLPAYLEDSRNLILHTAIDPKTGASKDHDLFSIEAVNPEDHQWLANITLPDEEITAQEKKSLLLELKRIFSMELHWLGKTEASAKVGMTKPFTTPYEHPLTKDSMQVTITLLSAACLLPIGIEVPPTNGGNDLLKAYQESWNELSKDSLKLIRFYADQQLIGGNYLHKRYGNGKPYNPRILTKAGGVFVFDINDFNKAKTFVEKWQKYGLPQLNGFSENWHENPYIAENGYGEIAVNLQIAPEPNGKTWQPIDEEVIHESE
ncbi:MAG: hypothetical protein KDF59_04325 [Nitrosomonas sp.]|nr:hypothetical protein [Nitrosomonas sp.]